MARNSTCIVVFETAVVHAGRPEAVNNSGKCHGIRFVVQCSALCLEMNPETWRRHGVCVRDADSCKNSIDAVANLIVESM